MFEAWQEQNTRDNATWEVLMNAIDKLPINLTGQGTIISPYKASRMIFVIRNCVCVVSLSTIVLNNRDW